MPTCLSRACLSCQAHAPYMYTHHVYHVRHTIRECHAHVLVLGVVLKTGLAWVWCRCIQRADQPIILTGFSALNKLLGREVYSSQMQLGGPKVIKRSQICIHCKQIIVHITVFLFLLLLLLSVFIQFPLHGALSPCIVCLT